MRLVENQGTILTQLRIPLRLGKQDAIGHELDARVLAELLIKAHLITDHSAHRHLQLFRHAPRHTHRRNPPRLRATHPPALQPQGLGDHLRQLRGLARPGVAHNHNDPMLTQGRKNLLPVRDHRQFLRIIP